ncbi:MAG: L-fuculose-phosphate aldolase [Halanaerobiales bacterium]
MLLENERELVSKYGRELIKKGLTTGTGGNISIYNPDKKLVAIKPSGIDYFKIKPEDVVVVNLAGNIYDGDKKPSSELQMHLEVYKNREDVGAVIHTHSIYSTTIACMNWEIPAVHYLVAFAGNKVPCAEYASFGSRELADNAIKALGQKYNASLLANHGLLAVGSDIDAALATAEEIEFSAEVYYRSRNLGEPVILSEDEMEIMAEKFKNYGQ